jgi:AcrR family transcriptional regulator
MDIASDHQVVEETTGRRKLINAALRLAAENRGMQALGIREIAREAELNHNTFYRHFADMEALALAVADELGVELRSKLHKLRSTITNLADMPRLTVRYTFEFIEQHPEAFTVAVRERYGPYPLVRNSLQTLLHNLASDMADDAKQFGRVAGVDDQTIFDIANTVIRHIFFVSMDYIAEPENQAQIEQWSAKLIQLLYMGAVISAKSEVNNS